MGSPISFSGFNQIDFNQILNAVMTQERAPLTRLETQKKTLETSNTAFSTLAGKLATLETAVENLKETDSLALLTASSNNSGVGVSATTGTVTGTYDIVVSELAKAQVSASTSTYAGLDSVVATGGSLTLTPVTGDPAVITISASTTLAGLVAAINNDDDSPVAASAVQTSPGVYQLMLTGKETGSANAFTITNALTGGGGVTFPGTHQQDAINAEFSVNGLDVVSSSNTVTDVIPGATLSLTKKDPATIVTVQVTRDGTAAKDKVKKFITAYNDLVTFAKDQALAATAGKASIGRDPLLRGVREALRDAVSDEYTDGGDLTRLAEIGVGFDMTGKMILDETLFADRLADSPADVQLLLSGTDGAGGAFGAMTTLIEEYTVSDGLVAETRQRIDEQVRALSRRIDTASAQLELRRLSLQREYIAADLAMTRLKAQSSSLQSVGSSYRLF
jgi:flagellar hook-associated protein 2